MTKSKVVAILFAICMIFTALPLANAFTVDTPSVGSTVRFAGSDWLCISDTGNYKLLRKDLAGSTAYGSGPYSGSNIRTHLNTTYYDTFSANEKTKIVSSTWNCGTQGNEAGVTVSDNIGLLTASEYNAIKNQPWYFNPGSNWWWLMTDALTVHWNGTIESWGVLTDWISLRPALYLDSGVAFTLVDGKYYAADEPLPTYTVSYDAEGGSVSPSSQTKQYNSTYGKAADGTTDELMPTPVKTGYTFAGWYDGDNGTGNQVTNATTVATSANHTLYARWTANTYTVNYNAAGGTVVPTSQEKLFGSTYGKASDGTTDESIPIPARDGYTFGGWWTGAGGTGSQVTNATTVATAASHTLYAKWTGIAYTVTYDPGAGSVIPSSQDKQFGSTYGKASNGTTDESVPTPARNGYTFGGWWTGAGGTGSQVTNATTVTTVGNHNVYAQWTANNYTVTYDGNTSTGGAVPTDGNNYHIGDSVTVSGNTGNLVKTGYTFAGWNTAADGSGSSNSGGDTIAMGSANVTLYAQWTANNYTVTYDGNTSTGGVVPTDGNNYHIGDSVSVSGNTGSLVKTGYTFAGWNTAADGSGSSNSGGDTIAMGSANVTLYARWTANNYTVTYNSNTGTGGVVPTDSNNYHLGDSVTVAGNTGSLVKAGYTFAGWNTAADGSGSSYSGGDTFTMGSVNVTLYAQWTANNYTVTYDGNTGTGGAVPTDGNNYHIGDSVTAAGNTGSLVKTGYTFAGWNTAADGSGSSYSGGDSITMGSVNVTLYAQWTANNYTVTYDGNTGTGGAMPTDGNNYHIGDSVTAAGNTGSLVKTGYTFAGWNTAADGSGSSYSGGDSITMGSSNIMLFAKWQIASSGSSSSTTPVETGVNIQVNGKTENAGTATTATNTNGQTVITIAVNAQKLEQKLSQEGSGAVVTIPLNTQSDVVVGQLTGQMVKNMETKEAVLEIKTGNVTYTLPAAQINIDNVSEQMGAQVQLKDIAVNVTISAPPQDTVKVVGDTARKNNYQVVVKPVEFEITCTSGGKTVDVSKFNGYVERMIAIPEGIDPTKITTGVVLNHDGTFSHVPTSIVVIDGKYYAKINSLTNSTYSVIWSSKTFADVENHWAKDAVNNMGSRLVINGVGDGRFEPDREITRAEFAAIVVKGLGLMRPGTGKDLFKDTTKDAWYYDPVSIAYDYGIISGYGDSKFGPMDKITREQAMTMIARAMKLTGIKAEFADGELEGLLAAFGDSGKSADYAKSSIAACLKAGIVSGRNGKMIAPKDNITRAEVAAIVRSLLQKSKLV